MASTLLAVATLLALGHHMPVNKKALHDYLVHMERNLHHKGPTE